MFSRVYVLIEKDPYEPGGQVLEVIGPFVTLHAATEARDTILKRGGHPDSEWTIMQTLSLSDVLDAFRVSDPLLAEDGD
jgi:hypothetical protein